MGGAEDHQLSTMTCHFCRENSPRQPTGIYRLKCLLVTVASHGVHFGYAADHQRPVADVLCVEGDRGYNTRESILATAPPPTP